MGSASIVSDLGGGQYSVSLTLERARITAAIAALTVRIAQLTDKILTMDAGVNKDIATLQKSALEKRKTILENAPADPTVSAWCADLTLALTGNVGTIEIPGERGTIQIQPGYDSGAVYSAIRDGQLQATIASTPAGVFYNWAMLPGWQKFKPTFRLGVLSDLDEDNDLCTVTLDVVASSAQGLGINQSTVISSVPIDYMDCNSIAFANDDRVVVEFEGQDWDSPKVIGFETNPRPCVPGENFVLVRCAVDDRNAPDGYVSEHWYYYFVWDIKNNNYAAIDNGDGGYVQYPCELFEIQDWLDVSVEAGVDLFDSSSQGEHQNSTINAELAYYWGDEAGPCECLEFDDDIICDPDPSDDDHDAALPFHDETGAAVQDYGRRWGQICDDCDYPNPLLPTWTHPPRISNFLTRLAVYRPPVTTYSGGGSGLVSWMEVFGEEEDIDPPAWSDWFGLYPVSKEISIENTVGGLSALLAQCEITRVWTTTNYGAADAAYDSWVVNTTFTVMCPLGEIGQYAQQTVSSWDATDSEATPTGYGLFEFPSFVRFSSRGTHNAVAMAQIHYVNYHKESVERPCGTGGGDVLLPTDGSHDWGEVTIGDTQVDIVASCRECDGTTTDPRTESRNTAFETALKTIYQDVVDTGLGNGFPLLDVYLYTHIEA